jgi:hypothetical protein
LGLSIAVEPALISPDAVAPQKGRVSGILDTWLNAGDHVHPEGEFMPSDLTTYFDNRQKYLANRPRFPLGELAKYAGRWIAWSSDGARIVAHTNDPRSLDELIRAAGADPEECLIEGIPAEDSVIGGPA